MALLEYLIQLWRTKIHDTNVNKNIYTLIYIKNNMQQETGMFSLVLGSGCSHNT